MTDINLAGLATLSFLVLFFPCTGLIHRRARAVAIRAQERDRQRELDTLMLEEAGRLIEQGTGEEVKWTISRQG